MKDAMQIRFLVDKNIRELPQSEMTRSAAVNETKAAVKVTNKSKSKRDTRDRAVTKAEIKRFTREELARKMMLFMFIIIFMYHFYNLHFKRKTMNDNMSDFLALIQLQ